MLNLAKTNISQMSEKGYRFELLLPETNEATGAFVTVRGDKSTTVVNYIRKEVEIMQAKGRKAKTRGKDPEEMTLSEQLESNIDFAWVRMIGWEGIMEGKNAVEFTEAEVKRVFKEHDWIRVRVEEKAQDLTNFLD